MTASYRGILVVLLLSMSRLCLGAPVPCAGGTIDITAESDTPYTLPTFNVGQQTTLRAVASGFTASAYSWAIPGPHLKDYNDYLGTKTTPALATPLAWSTMPLAAADLAAPNVSLYWKPSPAQVHPLTGPAESRTVTLTVTPAAGGACTASITLMIERNLTDPAKQPEDFYTSTHRAATTTNQGFGRVIDEHIYWHQFVGGGPDGHWLQFLAWHGHFLRRFDQWRAEFGYPPVAPWYPGRPLPTGPQFDHPASLRLAYNPDNNRIPTYYTLAGGVTADSGGQAKLADYATLNDFSGSFEGSYHGDVHCNIGPAIGGFFDTSGPGFGSMCRASSPKDPMFWRWHGFIDVLYRNYCRLKNLQCHSAPGVASDPWMGDNDADIAAGGAVPSPGPHWLSPDVWNRRAAVGTDACVPRDPPPNVNTVGGVTRDCGTSADHENPVSGVTNYLYATLRNTRPNAVRNVYAEVAVYVANASTGLSWPADFAMLPESRQMIALHLEPGQVTSIGPLPWTPPQPTPSDHWCLYVRVLTVQEQPAVEGTNVDTNVANSNSIAWRNVKIVQPGESAAKFIVRNIQRELEDLALEVTIPTDMLETGRVVIQLDPALQRAMKEGGGKANGLVEGGGAGLFRVSEAKARIAGLRLKPKQTGVVSIRLAARAEGEIHVSQVSRKGTDGGVTIKVAKKGAAAPKPR